MSSTKPLLLGAHMSIAGGFEKAISRGESIGCTAIQIFTKSNRQWAAKPITDVDAQSFKTAWKNSIIKSVIAHASYLINIASPEKSTRTKSGHALLHELERCHKLGIPSLVLHPGTCGSSANSECLKTIAAELDTILEQAPGNTQVLLEIMAGQGSSACYTFEQIAEVYHRSHNKARIGICLDTCHAFAAGYDFRSPAAYEHFWKSFDSIIGLKLLKAIHINDSKKDLGSRVDRHEELGHGKLGLEPFRLLFNDPSLFEVPKILETPKDDLPDYLKNMQIIRDVISEKNKKILKIYVTEKVTPE